MVKRYRKGAYKKMNVLVFGLGPIGIEILRNAYQLNPHSVIGAVDIDPNKVGKDIGELSGEADSGIKVTDNVQDVEKRKESQQVAIHATGSNLKHVWPQIKELLDNGYSVVSTCEQLSYPWHAYPELAKEIDEYAKSKNLTVIGTGINPGFIMDTMAVCFSTVLTNVKKITVIRNVDVSKRRIPLQKKVGIGMSEEEFLSLANQDKIGHVGLEESVRLIAYALNWKLIDVNNTIEPTIAKDQVHTPLTPLNTGDVSGLHQVSRGRTAEGFEIHLDLTMSAGIEQKDEIILEGNTTQRNVVPDGIFGDTSTAAMAINTAKRIDAIRQPGLLTMADIGLPRFTYQPS